MSQRNSGEVRQPSDLYETPPWALEVLLDRIVPPLPIWEPAAGGGNLVKVMERRYGAENVISSDIATGADFLKGSIDAASAKSIITNPPYNHARFFISKSLHLTNRHQGGMVAMLLPVDFDSGKTRRDLFDDFEGGFTKLVLTSRLRWTNLPQKASDPSQNHAWYVWQWGPWSRTIGWLHSAPGDKTKSAPAVTEIEALHRFVSALPADHGKAAFSRRYT